MIWGIHWGKERKGTEMEWNPFQLKDHVSIQTSGYNWQQITLENTICFPADVSVTIILEQFSSKRSVAEIQTYFKMVHDPFTEEVVQCSPCEAEGQDYFREHLPAFCACVFWLSYVVLALTGSSAQLLLLSVSVSNSSLIMVTGSNPFDTLLV